jgi:mono/diheme cytochrome c family protein
MRGFGLLHSTAGAALLLFGVWGGADAQQPTQIQIDDGRLLYDELCATCHGRDMVNSGAVSFDLRKFPKDDLGRFRNSVFNGKNTGMPAWRDKVTEDDLLVLWAYVLSGG